MHRFQAGLGDPEGSLVAEVVQIPIRRTIEDLLGDLYDKEVELRQGTDLLVLRLPVEQQWHPDPFAHPLPDIVDGALAELLGNTRSATAFARVDDRPVHLLHSFGGRHHLSPNVNPRFPHTALPEGISRDRIVEQIQKAEFDHLLEHSRAVITAAPGTVFEAPSGRLVRHFVRVGNIQFNRDAIDAVFFWLLPHLDRCAAILTDTWSISSIAFNVAALSQRYFGGEPRRVEMLPDYIDPANGSDLRAREIIERLVREAPFDPELDRILCLISATQSGSLRGTLGEIVGGGLSRFQERYVAIFALGDTDMPALRRLRDDPRFALLAPATDPDRPDHRIPIDRQVYFPLTFQEIRVEITRSVTEPSRQTVDELAGRSIFQVHRTLGRNQRSRHHAVHVATEAIADLPSFAIRLDAALAAVTRPPVLLVAPQGIGSERLADGIATRLAARDQAPVRTLLHPTLYLGENPTAREADVRAAIRAATDDDELVVAVDSWMNDAILSQYQRSLRTEGYRGRIVYIVGVACPSSLEAWRRTKSRLEFRPTVLPHAVRSLFELPLPDQREPDCPWCRETALYSRWARRTELPKRLGERIVRLNEAMAVGMTDDLFLSMPASSPLELGPSSFFVDQGSSQADAFAAVSSALQRLRSRRPEDGPPLGPRRFPVSTVLRHSDYLRETWTDSILRSIFLRGPHAEELTYADIAWEANRTKELRDLLLNPSPDQHDLALEILLAAALGKATLEVDAELRSAMSEIDADGTIAFFLDMMALDAEEAQSAVGTANASPWPRDDPEGPADEPHF